VLPGRLLAIDRILRRGKMIGKIPGLLIRSDKRILSAATIMITITTLFITAGAGVANASQRPRAEIRTTAAGRWVAAAHGVIPAGSKTQVVQGWRNGQGSCSFLVRDTLAPGQRSLQRQSLSYNLTSCQARMAVWTASTAVSSPRNTSGLARGGTLPASPSAAAHHSGSLLQPLAVSSSSGYVDTHTSDRFGIWVNEVKNTVNWTWDRTCVDGDSGSYYYWWLSNDGWQLEGNNWNNGYSCSAAQSSSYAHFYNYPFCGGTDVYYNRNVVDGWYNGRLTDSVGWSLGEYCTALLTGPWISLVRTR
jgi:hypothetical protein